MFSILISCTVQWAALNVETEYFSLNILQSVVSRPNDHLEPFLMEMKEETKLVKVMKIETKVEK